MKGVTPLHRLFFYLTILFLPVQLGYHFWPSWAMVLGRQVDYLSPTLYLTDVLVILLLVSWFIESSSSIKHFVSKINWRMLFVLFGFILLNIYVAVSRPVVIYSWIKIIEFFFLGLYIAKTKPALPNIAVVFGLSVLYSSLIAIVQFVLQRSIGGPLWFLGERTFTAQTPGIAQISLCDFSGSCRLLLRAYGTFPHPNVLGGFLAIVLPVLLYFRNSLRHLKNYTFLFRAAFVVGIIALLVTFSRTAWIVFGLGIILAISKRRQKVYAGFGIFAIVAVAVFFVSGVSGNIFESESVVVRNALNTSAIRMWQDAPVFGVGLGNFLVALPHYLVSRQIYFLQPVHNIYLLLLSQIGIVGSIGVISLGVLTARHILRNKNNNSIFAIAFLGILLLGLTDHYLLTLQEGQLLTACVAGLLFAGST